MNDKLPATESELSTYLNTFKASILKSKKLPLSKLNDDTFIVNSEMDYLISQLFSKLESTKTANLSLCVEATLSLLVELKSAGISLNPRMRQATIMLNINSGTGHTEPVLYPTYQGIRDIAVAKGIITNAVAALVYKNDKFEWKGNFETPIHCYDPFLPDRGELRGGVCKATLTNGDVIVSAVSREALEKSFHMSQSVESRKLWQDRTEQMLLAKIIRYSSNDWPNTRSVLGQYAQ